MSAAKQVHARALHVVVPKGVLNKLLNTALESLLGGSPANTDTIPLRASRQSENDIGFIENASAVTIPAHPIRVVGNLLRLTALQRQLLRSTTQSVTANEFGNVEGGNAVFVSYSLKKAAVTLHSMGFTLEREGGRVASPRFVKTIETESGRSCVATAWMEMNGELNSVYTTICVD